MSSAPGAVALPPCRAAEGAAAAVAAVTEGGGGGSPRAVCPAAAERLGGEKEQAAPPPLELAITQGQLQPLLSPRSGATAAPFVLGGATIVG